MNRYYFIFIISLISIFTKVSGQDTLPRFTVKNVGNNRIIIGWVNNYGLVKQIGIQSSFDSLRNYKTILSVTDPNARENGFADTKAQSDHMYYRLFVVLDKGQFFFTAARQPAYDTARLIRNKSIEREKDTMVISNIKTVDFAKRNDFIPSFFVYTNKDGYVFINLPDADRKKYHIKFFDEDNSMIFEIRSIKEPALTIDKANFLHAGWFRFELYNDDTLIEKNKLYLAKEF